ncbi:MAG: bifunctional enzyme CysN/CysC [Myxococcota bacterium]|jgi:bifunctional enzyme CysN/CysC
MRFLTCGSVDDGKSTLIGRLLYDSKLVYEDQLAAVKSASIRHGTTGTDFDPALLTDGLRAEREQGITIDVAYRYFSTARRKFIIADTPGHEQYTRNMATGASNCDLAIILIDARHGVQTQTRRHSFIVSLLGIKHVIVAINKMDLVDWSEARFDEIGKDYTDFVSALDIPDVRLLPMSALLGDNVVNASEHMDWYDGGTLMHLLEHVHIGSDRNLTDFRFPVQYVNRPNLNFRGYCGTVASGRVSPGDPVTVLPSGKTSTVARVVTYDGDIEEAFAPMAVTLVLEDEVDISRGDMLVHPDNVPTSSTEFEAHLVWMTEEPLAIGHGYLVKHTTNQAPAVVSAIRHRVDINTLDPVEAGTLNLNEIGKVAITLSRPISFDRYKDNRQTGAFILVDRITNNTVAAGMILMAGEGGRGQSVLERLGSQSTVDAVVRSSQVSAQQRRARVGHGPATLWLTGPTGSGKRSIAYALEQRLFELGCLSSVVDGYQASAGLNAGLGTDSNDLAEATRRTAEVARALNGAGLIAIGAELSHRASGRSGARTIVTRDGGAPFLEVYLEATDASVSGEPVYEAPTNPELTVATGQQTLDDSVAAIIALMRKVGLLNE